MQQTLQHMQGADWVHQSRTACKHSAWVQNDLTAAGHRDLHHSEPVITRINLSSKAHVH